MNGHDDDDDADAMSSVRLRFLAVAWFAEFVEEYGMEDEGTEWRRRDDWPRVGWRGGGE